MQMQLSTTAESSFNFFSSKSSFLDFNITLSGYHAVKALINNFKHTLMVNQMIQAITDIIIMIMITIIIIMIIIIINMEMTACQTKPVLRPLQPVAYSNQLGSAHALLRIRLW